MANAYDDVRYEGHPFPQTHPDRLATLGRLFGMQPAPVERCRVLELGCADAGNLIPMAYTLRGSEFVGIDLGAAGIAKGRAMADALGLSNIELRALDILEAGTDLGRFDYILAHGVFSWVPPAVQERMLAICRDCLNPQGIAYISYDVYPGAHARTMIAEMMRFHAGRFPEPQQQIEQARWMLEFATAAQSEPTPYAWLLRQELEWLAARRPESIYHDELAEWRRPLYFREFVAEALRHELQYLGEADFWEMQESVLAPETGAVLRRIAPDPIAKEQYMDFVKGRRFRQTLLCHADVKLRRGIESRQMREFFVRAAGSRKENPRMPTEHPAAIAAMDVVNRAWPGAVSFDELRASARAEDDLLLADIVLAFFACGLFQMHVTAPCCARDAGEFPRGSALARRQARFGPLVTNLCHETVRIEDELARRMFVALDGTRQGPAVLAELGAPEDGIQRLAKLALLEA